MKLTIAVNLALKADSRVHYTWDAVDFRSFDGITDFHHPIFMCLMQLKLEYIAWHVVSHGHHKLPHAKIT